MPRQRSAKRFRQVLNADFFRFRQSIIGRSAHDSDNRFAHGQLSLSLNDLVAMKLSDMTLVVSQFV